MDPSFLNRNVNEGFSGGERKRNEILQLAVLEVLLSRLWTICQIQTCQSDMAILDEIDSGMDIDALRDVADAVNGLKSEKTGVLLVTHYKVSTTVDVVCRFMRLRVQRLLGYIKPDFVHVMQDGRIAQTGDSSLADTLEEKGYAPLQA